MTTNRAARRCFFALLLLAAVLMGFVVRPLASALFVAAALAGVLWPLHERLTGKFGGRRYVSAAVWVLAVVVVILGPIVAFSTFAIKEAGDGWRFLSDTLSSEGVHGLLHRLPGPLERLGSRLVQDLPAADPGALAQQLGVGRAKAASAVGATISATTSFLFHAAMALIAFYFLLMEGDRLVSWIDGLSPLAPGQTRELLREFRKTSYAVIFSTIITAGVQALAALLGYLITHVPHPIFFAGVTFFVAFIPAVGAGAATLAAALLLYITGHAHAALFLAIWALTAVGLIDNLVKPLLIKGGLAMHGAVVFFALIGGLAAFGGVGLLLGPLVVAAFLALIRIYQRDFRSTSFEG
jgi:predicted PurR-regulated permease PerM